MHIVPDNFIQRWITKRPNFGQYLIKYNTSWNTIYQKYYNYLINTWSSGRPPSGCQWWGSSCWCLWWSTSWSNQDHFEDDDDDEEEEDVDVCGDQLPDQTKITLRMIGIFKIPAGRLREDKLSHDPPVENASWIVFLIWFTYNVGELSV